MIWVRICIVAGGLAGACGVILNALSAHVFGTQLEAKALTTLVTVADYLLVHGLLLLMIAIFLRLRPDAVVVRAAGALVVLGLLLFCGGLGVASVSGNSLYASAAPLGGMALISGWTLVSVYGLSKL